MSIITLWDRQDRDTGSQRPQSCKKSQNLSSMRPWSSDSKPGAHYVTSICAMVWTWSKRRLSAHHSGLGVSLQGIIPTYPHSPGLFAHCFWLPSIYPFRSPSFPHGIESLGTVIRSAHSLLPSVSIWANESIGCLLPSSNLNFNEKKKKRT